MVCQLQHVLLGLGLLQKDIGWLNTRVKVVKFVHLLHQLHQSVGDVDDILVGDLNLIARRRIQKVLVYITLALRVVYAVLLVLRRDKEVQVFLEAHWNVQLEVFVIRELFVIHF